MIHKDSVFNEAGGVEEQRLNRGHRGTACGRQWRWQALCGPSILVTFNSEGLLTIRVLIIRKNDPAC